MSEKELVERLERLERALRRRKGFALATIYATEAVPQTITAHRFIVADDCMFSVSGK